MVSNWKYHVTSSNSCERVTAQTIFSVTIFISRNKQGQATLTLIFSDYTDCDLGAGFSKS
jgi:hypothetical protein